MGENKTVVQITNYCKTTVREAGSGWEELTCFGCEFIIRTFNNRINGASFGTKTAIDTFRHINIVPYGTACAILTFLCFDRNCLCRASGFTQLARDTTFFTRWITTKGMLPTKSWTQIPTFKWIVDGNLWFRKCLTRQGKGTENLRQEKYLG